MKERGTYAPVSHHDTEEDALAHARAYARGAHIQSGGETVAVADGSQFIVRRLEAGDQPTFAELWPADRGSGNVVAGVIDPPGDAAVGALDAETLAGVGIGWRERAHGTTAVAALAVATVARGRGLASALLERLPALARECGCDEFSATIVTRTEEAMGRLEARGDVSVRKLGERTAELTIAVPDHGGATGLAEILRAVSSGSAWPSERAT